MRNSLPSPAGRPQDEGLAGIETLLIVIGVLVFASTTLFAIGRLMLTKIDLTNLASAAARAEANADTTVQPTHTTDRYGDPVTLAITVTPGACGIVDATAQTTVPLVGWLPTGGANSIDVSATATSPLNVYQSIGQGGFACTGG